MKKLSVFFLLFFGGLDLANAATAKKADLVLRNGLIYTVDAARTWAETVAVQDGKICLRWR